MPGGDRRVLLQDIRNFTVQIRHSAAESIIIGTGFLVSVRGIVVTCAHVLEAGGVDVRGGGDQTVRVYFPRRGGRQPELRSARVAAYFTAVEDDITCLQIDGLLPLPKDRVALIGSATLSRMHPFESYGYRRLAKYAGGLAYGQILGEVDPPENVVLLAEPIQLESSHINSGMSGSAVLDVERNLVVGVVSETWAPSTDTKDRDTAWAVNVSVLGFTGLDITIQHDPLPLRRAPQPVIDPALSTQTVPSPGDRLAMAPSPLAEWVGRGTLLEILTRCWGEDVHVVGLIGFGGEGKSSLARRWIDLLLESEYPPAGVFWWSFSVSANTEEFLHAAIEFMSGGRISASDTATGEGRASVAAGLLRSHRYLFVLDGLEVAQHQTGEQYGSMTSNELRDFLAYFAAPGHPSFCVLTSRAPVLDLAPYVTYRHVDVLALGVASGVQLLREFGVSGSTAALAQVVVTWAGHALTLSLIAAYLTRTHRGDVRQVTHIPPPEAGMPHDEMVRRVLVEYDACLSAEERSFLVRLSVFRRAVDESGLSVVGLVHNRAEVLRHLSAARIIHSDVAGQLRMHPLVRDFYAEIGQREPAARRGLHADAMRYYLRFTPDAATAASIDDLAIVVEVVHHACQSGEYDRACDIVHDQLYQGERGLLTRELNAWETALTCLLELFPQRRTQGDPLVTEVASRAWLLHEVATCLQMVGRLRESAAMARRAAEAFGSLERWHDAAVSCQNLTELYFSLGSLASCPRVIEDAFGYADRADDREDELVAETLRGALAHYQGRPNEAGEAFAAALRIAAEFTPIPALYSSSGHRYAEHLHRSGRGAEAREVNLLNLEICREAGWTADEAVCLTIEGRLALAAGDPSTAAAVYRQARRIADAITRRDVLIEALIGHAYLAMELGDPGAARSELDQALVLARLGGYRLAEISALVWSARVDRTAGNSEAAWQHAVEAEQLSLEIDYHWGRVDARTVLDRLR
jgi:tetratricopeptide (TPR) repeat protein